jgi:hypothetical protein
MPTPDGWIRWYYTKREDIGAPGLDLVKARGFIYATRCESTSTASRRARGEHGPCTSEIRNPTKAGGYVCGRCGAPWRHWERHQLRGEVQESKRGDGFELAHARWLDIGVLLDRLLNDPKWRWESRLLIANANGHSLNWLVQYGPTEFPEAPFQWKRWKVAEVIQAGRTEWVRRLTGAGIDFDDPTGSWRHLLARGRH